MRRGYFAFFVFIISDVLFFIKANPGERLGFDVIPYEVSSEALPEVSRPRSLETPLQGVVAHCMGCDLQKSVEILRGEAGYPVSSHYFIPAVSGAEFMKKFELQGVEELNYPDQVPVVRFVSEDRAAFHAGISTWSNWNQLVGCEKGLNNCTLGVEVHCPGYANGLDKESAWNFEVFEAYKPEQEKTVTGFFKHIIEKHNLPKHHLLAHSTIAPGRKTDPGPLFFWKALEREGLGLQVNGDDFTPHAKIDDEAKALRQHLRNFGFTALSEEASEGELEKNMEAFFMQFDPDYYWQRVGRRASDKASFQDKVRRALQGLKTLPKRFEYEATA